MSPEVMRIKTAEICGFRWFMMEAERIISGQRDRDKWFILCLKSPHRTAKEVAVPEASFDQDSSETPNYPEDLNAMHEARKTLTMVQQIEYVAALWRTNPKSEIEGFKWNQNALSQEIWWTLTNATAIQHNEAFLRVHNAWEES